MGVIERGRPAEKLRRDTRSPAFGIASVDAGKHACSEESEPEKCETDDDDDDSIRPAVGTAAQGFASDRVPAEQHYQPNGHDENPDRDRRDKLQHRSGSSRDASHAEASILSLRQIPTGRESLDLVARRARSRQNNHAGAPANATRIPGMISQAGTGRREDLGPEFCTTQPQKNTPRSLRRVPATISTVGPHLPERVDRPAPPFAGGHLAVHTETSIPPYRHISVARNQADDSASYGQVTITRAFNLTPLQSALPRRLAAMKQGDRRNTHIEALV